MATEFLRVRDLQFVPNEVFGSESRSMQSYPVHHSIEASDRLMQTAPVKSPSESDRNVRTFTFSYPAGHELPGIRHPATRLEKACVLTAEGENPSRTKKGDFT